MAKPLQGFNAMQSDRVIPTTDPRSFRGGQVATPEQRGQRLKGMGEGYLSSIMDLPMRGMEALAPDAGYTPGELRSSPQDRARGQRYAWEDYQQDQAQDPDYSMGMDLGEDIALVADPFFDIPLAGAAKMAPYAAKALRSETLGADALSGMRGLLENEEGLIKAYHGTPHEVDQFRMDRIGTGEGAQAYGHGLYFAENQKVAKEYQDALSLGKDQFFINTYGPGKGIINLASTIKSDYKNITRTDELLDALRKRGDEDLLWTAEKLDAKGELAEFSGWSKKLHSGNTYEVDLDVNPEDLLDWDKQLSEQPEKIRNLLGYKQNSQVDEFTGYRDELVKKYGTRRFQGKVTAEERAKLDTLRHAAGDDFMENISGQEAYSRLQEKIASGEIWPDAPENVDLSILASEYLRKEGVPGLRYLDQASRSGGSGSRNVVMFGEEGIKITGRNQ